MLRANVAWTSDVAMRLCHGLIKINWINDANEKFQINDVDQINGGASLLIIAVILSQLVRGIITIPIPPVWNQTGY